MKTDSSRHNECWLTKAVQNFKYEGQTDKRQRSDIYVSACGDSKYKQINKQKEDMSNIYLFEEGVE